MKFKILLIEDDPVVSDTIASIFQSFYVDAEVEYIGDGPTFRAGRWKMEDWSLVVLDLMMPGITGFEVCDQLRQHARTKKVPILALTGYDTLQNEERIKAAGATGYMAKPFEISNFLDEVRKLVG